ncbi:MAG TPA: MaoC family dehydratase N-terminal domain-containing protein [Nocardioidaceae bacterium]|nr:MaoC family dehydratase N-terminal domain-containing protein [Nocardioidaceae bacterium]
MPLDPGLAGRTFAPTPPYTVSREKIAEFNTATGAEPIGDGSTAPLTFPIVVAFGAMTQLMTDPEVGVELHNIVHGDQRFEQKRPIRAGDELVGSITIDTLRNAAGMDMIGTRTEISTVAGEHVATAYATLVHRGGPA